MPMTAGDPVVETKTGKQGTVKLVSYTTNNLRSYVLGYIVEWEDGTTGYVQRKPVNPDHCRDTAYDVYPVLEEQMPWYYGKKY